MMEPFSLAVDFLKHTSNVTIVIAGVTLLLAVLSYFIIRDIGVPPGPIGVPILGYWPFMRSELSHVQLPAFKKKYGDVFSIRITGKLYIVLAGMKVLREAHVTKVDCFRDRTTQFNLLGYLFTGGLIYSPGDKWKTLRKFFALQLKVQGMSFFQENTAEATSDNINALLNELQQHSNKSIDIQGLIFRKLSNIIRKLLYGANTTVTELEVLKFHIDYKYVISLVDSSNIILIGNFARYCIAPFLPNYKKCMQLHDKLKDFLQDMIDDHKRTFDGENERDMIDAYLKEKYTRAAKGDPTAEYFTDQTLISTLFMFSGDGVVNGSLFVSTIIKALLDHPEEQEKIYEELVEVCGERNPWIEDRSKLHYTNAFILEAARIDNFIALFPNTECCKETTIGGYRIPVGALTVTSVYSIHTDPQVYPNPEKFDPSRFLSTEGKPKVEPTVSFGVGRRSCLGEGLIMMQTFLFCISIVKNFKLSYAEEKSHYELLRSRSLYVHITPRK